MKTITFQLAGSDEIFQAEEWRLEAAIEEAKHKAGLPSWVEYKEIDAHTEPHPDLAAYLSDVCNPNKPTTIPKRSRKAKTKSQATNMSTVLNVLDDIDPINLVPEVLRDRMRGPNPTVSNGMDK